MLSSWWHPWESAVQCRIPGLWHAGGPASGRDVLAESIISSARVSAEVGCRQGAISSFQLILFSFPALHPHLKRWDVPAVAHLAVHKSLC